MMKGNRNGETILEIMMGYVAPIVGGIITTVTLDQITSLPRWVCFAIWTPPRNHSRMDCLPGNCYHDLSCCSEVPTLTRLCTVNGIDEQSIGPKCSIDAP